MKKKILCFLVVLTLLAIPFTASAANSDYNFNLPYYSYTYDSNKMPVLTPAPYAVSETINGADLGIGGLLNPSDIFYSNETSLIYITDQGNNRIVAIDLDYKLVKVIDGFDKDGVHETFASPSSAYVKNGALYIADTENHRIVCLNSTDYSLVKVLDRPDIVLLGDDYEYLPNKIAVDLADRIYVVAKNVNKGLVLLDPDGNFIKFAGAPKVVPSLLDKFWRLFMTEVQIQQMDKAVPTEYNSIHIDKDGFIYLSTQSDEVDPISKLNTQGDNILDSEDGNYPSGDSNYTGARVTSIFNDVAVRDDGIYAALDTTMNRIFVYDQEGSLLYAFGDEGSQSGTFFSPTSVEMYGDIILVADAGSNNKITVFKQTEFGSCVDKAVTAMIDGKYDESSVYWSRIIELCPSYDSAYIYLARVDINNKNYSEALDKLLGTGKMNYYSKAFQGYREEIIRNNFYLFLIIIIAIVVIIIVLKKVFKRYRVSDKINKVKVIKEFRYSNYVMFHPFDGFWDLKREKRGSAKAASIILVLFIITYGLRAQYTGYIFSGELSSDINVLKELAAMLIPIFLWIVSNWCFTTLMEGEGTMKDIYVCTMYALKPYVITAIPLLLLSHCLSADESFIYTALSTIVTIWMLALIFFGMMTTHDYSLLKGIVTAILTLVGIILIIFLALVFIDIVEDIVNLVTDMFKEVSYRTY